MTVYAGSTARIDLGIADTIQGVAYDPGVLRLTLISPQNEITTYTYGVDSQLVKDASGSYHADLTFPSPGKWRGKVEAQGSIDGAIPFSVDVLPIGATF